MSFDRFSHSSLGLCAVIAALGGCSGRGDILPQSQSGAENATRGGEPILEVLHVFRAPARGQNPVAPVVAGASGNFYGETFDAAKPTPYGGCGTVFKLTPSGGRYVEATLRRFENKPVRRIKYGGGTVFKLTP